MPVAPSSESEIASALAELPAWSRVDGTIERVVECVDFAAAVALVVRIGFLAEAADHHPDLDVRWRRVRVACTTHDCGGLSARDFALAHDIDAVVESSPGA